MVRVLRRFVSAVLVAAACSPSLPASAAGAPHPAFSLLNERVRAVREAFYVYRDGDSGLNHGFASGLFGQIGKIDVDPFCVFDSATGACSADANELDRVRGTVLRVSFGVLDDDQFAGINMEEPEHWGGTLSSEGYDLRGATQVVFDVYSPDGARVQFGVAGQTGGFVDIANTWQTMSISLSSLALSQSDLDSVHILFSVATNDANAPAGGTVLLDDIRFEPVPASQKERLGFPLGTETFGVVPVPAADPGRVPVPPDQLLRNATTTYESALTLLALLARGAAEDVGSAHIIADALVYALAHPNHGLALPLAPDGSNGLHSAYESGDLALFNDQTGAGQLGQAGDVRLAGFSAGTGLCGATEFCLLLDGATGGNNAFAILALVAAYQRFGEPGYLDAARAIGNWIAGNLRDTTGTGYGGYYLGYPDEGKPKVLLTGKSTENNADIFAAFEVLAATERTLGDQPAADEWAERAEAAGDFVMEMYDSATGCFNAGTVPEGSLAGPGVDPTGVQQGGDVINIFPFLDANSFAVLALAWTPRYAMQIDWRQPVQCILDAFAQSVAVGGEQLEGFSIVASPNAGPDGVAWEFTGQAVASMRLSDRLHGEQHFKADADLYRAEIDNARAAAAFGDGRGTVASTLEGGDSLPPIEQCLSTPFQCIPERVGIAATVWGLFAERNDNPLAGRCLLDVDGSGRPPELATDVVYIARRLLGLPAAPPSFRVLDPFILPDADIEASIDAMSVSLDFDASGAVELATDVVYLARYLTGLPSVPPTFRILDPSIPSDGEIEARIEALCPGP